MTSSVPATGSTQLTRLPITPACRVAQRQKSTAGGATVMRSGKSQSTGGALSNYGDKSANGVDRGDKSFATSVFGHQGRGVRL